MTEDIIKLTMKLHAYKLHPVLISFVKMIIYLDHCVKTLHLIMLNKFADPHSLICCN